ncbi:MAG: hypothetical protein LQ342_004747 [Letrouitia transgressa]|nr:MAG: hypothetical protein LQ342_004747 [Letrouitia transgressa]
MGRNKKRKRSPDHGRVVQFGPTLSFIEPGKSKGKPEQLPEQKPVQKPRNRDQIEAEDWTLVGKHGKKRKTDNYPTLVYAKLHTIRSAISISDLRDLALYCLADGTSPQWISVRHHFAVKKAVILCVPGLEQGMFDGSIVLDPLYNKNKRHDYFATTTVNQSPDDYLPVRLAPEKLCAPLKPLADIFDCLWPVKAPGNDKHSKLYSPLYAMLYSPIPKSLEEQHAEKNIKGPKLLDSSHWESQQTHVYKYIASRKDLIANNYKLHPAWFDSEEEKEIECRRREENKQTEEYGWVDTAIKKLEDGVVPESEIEDGSVTAGHTVLAVDCEMCMVEGDEHALTRISVVNWDGNVVMDELVKPERPIIDYLTELVPLGSAPMEGADAKTGSRYSGITQEKLEHINTSVSEIQGRLLEIISPRTILVGHSLNADLDALKMTHPFIIDTSLIYPHHRGQPLKNSLKWLAGKYLDREIQNGGASGHNSIEDSLACMDLLKMKCEKGPTWGTSEASSESIFKRLSRTSQKGAHDTDNGGLGKTGAIIDHGANEKAFAQVASTCIGCNSDSEVVDGVMRAALGDLDGGGVDLTWARLRELEAHRGWMGDDRSTVSKFLDDQAFSTKVADPSAKSLSAMVISAVSQISNIHSKLPPGTLFVVYTGNGDPRDLIRLNEMESTFRREYHQQKIHWEDLSVKWTDREGQALARAFKKARQGIGFATIT